MPSATIKLFLPFGDPQRLRTAEISNWTGKGIAAPRTDFADLLAREECSQSGVYVLTGVDPETGRPACYIGEAEAIRDRLKQHKARDFWVQAVTFVSKDENLTKAHIRYLEGRLIADAQKAGRVLVLNTQMTVGRLPESDREDMEVFLSKVHQLLPVLGSDLLTPLVQPESSTEIPILLCEIKGLRARGRRTPSGFVVLEGSEAVLDIRPSATVRHGFVLELRDQLVKEGVLIGENGRYRFSKAFEFSSPSTAAGVIQGGSANGLTAWRDASGKTLKDLETPPSA